MSFNVVNKLNGLSGCTDIAPAWSIIANNLSSFIKGGVDATYGQGYYYRRGTNQVLDSAIETMLNSSNYSKFRSSDDYANLNDKERASIIIGVINSFYDWTKQGYNIFSVAYGCGNVNVNSLQSSTTNNEEIEIHHYPNGTIRISKAVDVWYFPARDNKGMEDLVKTPVTLPIPTRQIDKPVTQIPVTQTPDIPVTKPDVITNPNNPCNYTETKVQKQMYFTKTRRTANDYLVRVPVRKEFCKTKEQQGKIEIPCTDTIAKLNAALNKAGLSGYLDPTHPVEQSRKASLPQAKEGIAGAIVVNVDMTNKVRKF